MPKIRHMAQDTVDLIGSAEVCRMLGIDRATLSRWVNHREPALVPVMQLPGKNGAYLFHREDVDSLLSMRSTA